ncbi:MAG: hypothetical protein AB7R55_02115 [Gemmatimonadales bacterium]
MASIRSELPQPQGDARVTRLLGEDYRFDPARIEPLAAFRIEHAAVHFLERPLALARHYRLIDEGGVTLAVELRLCWRGGVDPIESLFQFVESFQRGIPTEQVRRISDEGIGDFGLAWSWDDPLGAQIVAFIRANVLVTVQAPDAVGLAERVARAIDGALARLPTIDGYPEPVGGALDRVREKAGTERPAVAPGGRLDLAQQPKGERWFWVTTGGAANRDPAAPDHWYYRAGTEPGPVEIRLFRVDEGLLPVAERLALLVS